MFIFPENGSVDYDEFCGLMKDFVVGGDAVMEVKIREAFKLFDLNSDGMITKDELSKAISKIGSKVSDEEIDNLVKIIDRDGDQKINYDGKTQSINNSLNVYITPINSPNVYITPVNSLNVYITPINSLNVYITPVNSLNVRPVSHQLIV